MRFDLGRVALAFALVLLCSVAGRSVEERPTSAESTESFFELKVRPVLVGSCVKCHGQVKASAGLRLDSREAILKGGESGPAIVPGDPESSLLVQAIGHEDDSLKMPPNKPLPATVRADLTAWIAAGARWPKSQGRPRPVEGQGHWAFEPLRVVSPPDDPSDWATSPIDRLISAGHRAHGVKPVDRAERSTLIRRASFDLVGLPPSPERIEAFLADDRPDAFARLIDELLASPQYGERWGRYWLDLARYADTAGDNSDYPIPQAYLYRDYVIDAFNADVPYDRFLHEQIAGDILAKEGPREDFARCVIATGFVAQAKRFGTFKLEDIHQIIEDTLNTTGQVVLGLSLRCARCHDHKFDPISSRDYYALYGIFASTSFPFAGAEEEKRPSELAPLIPPTDVAARIGGHAQAIAELKSEIARKTEALKSAPPTAKEALEGELKQLRNALSRKEKEPALAGVPAAYAVREGKPADARIQKGGNPGDLGETVRRGVLTCLDRSGTLTIPEGSSGRLELARWLTSGPARALAARVMVNRIWQHHFGKPIVPTPSDFGLRGTPPTHPELLEWLAGEFVASGWSVKAMHRRIMLSKTYQLAARVEPENAERDTGNAWYWRADRHPLDAEALRDAVLDLAGSLDRSRPGPHPFPPQEKWTYTAHHQFKAVYPSDHRSVYLMVQRLQPHPYLSLFNGPDTSLSTAVRDSATMPQQSLFLVNSAFIHQQAARLARALCALESHPPDRLRLAYLRVFGRTPTESDETRALAFLARYERSLEDEGLAPGRREIEAWSGLTRAMLASNEFIYVD